MEQYAYDLGKSAIEQGHKVIFVVRNDGDVVPNRVRELGPVYELPLSGKFDFYSIRQLRKIVNSEAIDVIHTHQPKNIFHARMASRGLDVRVVHTLHFVINSTSPHWLYKRIFNMADRIIAVSEIVRRRALEVYSNIEPSKVVTILNSVDSTRLGAVMPLPNGDVPVVGYAGRVVKEKGIEVFLDALTILKNKNIKFSALIAGTGGAEYVAHIENKIKANGLSDCVTMVGFIKDISSFTSKIDIAVLPSVRIEACSLMAIEYMAAGRPLVASDSGGQVEIIESGLDGLIVPVGDSAANADALQMLISSAEMRKNMGIAAKAKYDGLLNFDRFIEKTIAQYRR